MFNEDEESFTFFGFSVNRRGHAIDPVSSDVIKSDIMSERLRSLLLVNKIDMSEGCHKWKRYYTFQSTIIIVITINVLILVKLS